MTKEHEYTAEIIWTGDRGAGTEAYDAYDRTWSIETPGKPVIHCSNDPLLGGDPTLPNPEDLHLASRAGIVVRAYSDSPVGVGVTAPNGAGRFLRATLRPRIEVAAETDLERADAIHHDIHQYCFIARSVNFPVSYEATYAEWRDDSDAS